MRFLFLFSVLLFLGACTEPRKACLDIEATNFDAAADEDCCCEYPQLNLEMLFRFDTLVWKPDTAYEYTPGKWFRLKSIAYYLSDFQFNQNGQAFTISDTLPFKTWGPAGDTTETTFIDDFTLIRRTANVYQPGTFRPPGTFESVRFRLGVPVDAQRIIPGLTPTGSPLRLQSDALWLGRDTGYVAMKIVLSRDTLSATVPDTLVISRPEYDNIVIEQLGNLQHESGYNFKLKLTADYHALFQNVNLSGGDISAWKAQIVANLPQSFRVSQ